MRVAARSILVVGTFLLSVLLYVDRVCISAAKNDVAADLRLDDQQMGWVFAAFSLGYALFQTPSGWLANVAKIARNDGFFLASIDILGSSYAPTPLSSSLWFYLYIFGADMTLSPSWSTCVDIGKSKAGIVSGTMNMAGNIGSFLTTLAFPYLLAWCGSPWPFFYTAALIDILAIALWFAIDPTNELDSQ